MEWTRPWLWLEFWPGIVFIALAVGGCRREPGQVATPAEQPISGPGGVRQQQPAAAPERVTVGFFRPPGFGLE